MAGLLVSVFEVALADVVVFVAGVTVGVDAVLFAGGRGQQSASGLLQPEIRTAVAAHARTRGRTDNVG